jgi:hypothetical protein
VNSCCSVLLKFHLSGSGPVSLLLFRYLREAVGRQPCSGAATEAFSSYVDNTRLCVSSLLPHLPVRGPASSTQAAHLKTSGGSDASKVLTGGGGGGKSLAFPTHRAARH